MEKLALLDCGGQYTKVIDRRVRELGVYSDILPMGVHADQLKEYNAIIFSGGPNSVWSEKAFAFDPAVFQLNIPILGICYGMQLICHYYGGLVSPNVKKEYGENEIIIDAEDLLFNGMDKKQMVLMSHGDTVAKIPEGFHINATSGEIIAGISCPEKKVYGLQFHPEVDLTPNGIQIIDNFLRKIVGFKENYTLEDRIQNSIKYIQETVKDNKVIVLVSGGVDSAVSAALLLKALDANNVYAIHIDTGLMRKNESDIICKNLEKIGFIHLIRENAKSAFFNNKAIVNGKEIGPLTTLIDPEEKRNLIGEIFIQIVKEVAEKLNIKIEDLFIAQGTLRPDLIESGNPDVSSYANKIKTHHNDVDIIRRARKNGHIIETNWDWHKDEVRNVARMLGLDEAIASRQPFPGPGLSVRVLCHDKDNIISPSATQDLQSLLENYSGYSGTIVPLKTVGVQGDVRSYRNLCLVSHESEAYSWNDLYNLSKEITDQIDCVNRVGFILNNKNLHSCKTNLMTINDENVELLRQIDAITTESFFENISQTFAVLLPIGDTKKYSIAVRTFISNDFMTGRPAFIDHEVSREQIKEYVNLVELKFGNQIEYIIYDITSKPPATCEWQ